MPPLISLATLDDIPALAELLSLLFAQEVDFTPDRAKQEAGLRQIIESPDAGRIFVARREANIVGMVSLVFTISTAEGGLVAWLEDMIVVPKERGSGLGSQLVETAKEHAKVLGISRISLLTDGDNQNAIRFYLRAGFSESEMIVLRLYI